MTPLQQLREKRAALAKDLHTLVGEPGSTAVWTAENQTVYDAKMSEIDGLDASIKRIVDVQEKLSVDNVAGDIADRADHSASKGSKAAKLFAKWVRGGDSALSAADWTEVRNTMSTTTGSEGGFSVQTDVATKIMDALKAFGGVRSVATVLQTAMGNPMSFPTSDGTSETGEQIAENTTVTGADIVLGTLPLNTYKFSSKVVAVPFELLQDAQVDVESFVNARLATRIGRITNTRFTVGTGVSQPNGVVTAAASGKVGTTGQTLTVIFDDLVDLVHSVDPAYRQLPGCAFMMNDASLKVVRKLKDSQGRPIFLPGYDSLAGPMPDSLLGYPIVINQDMAVMAANAKSILFGNFSFYYVRDVVGSVSMFRFTDSAYAKLGQVGFLQFMRSGGNLMDVGGCIKFYANSAT
jgi:HK97 family phage major capsid protein